MPVLRFKAEDVRRVVEHSVAAPRQSDVAYTTKPVEAPAVLLVHEQGVYLMSNGQPRDIVGADAADRSFCAYGCHPEKDADWYETARGLVGGDDFVEMKRLRIELGREPYNLFAGDNFFRALKTHADSKIVEPFDHGKTPSRSSLQQLF